MATLTWRHFQGMASRLVRLSWCKVRMLWILRWWNLLTRASHVRALSRWTFLNKSILSVSSTNYVRHPNVLKRTPIHSSINSESSSTTIDRGWNKGWIVHTNLWSPCLSRLEQPPGDPEKHSLLAGLRCASSWKQLVGVFLAPPPPCMETELCTAGFLWFVEE